MNGRAKALLPDTEATETVAAEREALSFDDVFLLHHRAVYRCAYGLVRDAGLAEDVTQEVFIQFYRHRDHVPEGETLRPWLLRVAINTSRNSLRGRHRASNREERFANEMPDGAMSLAAATTIAPDEEYERQLQIQKTRETLLKIKEPMRSCLLLQQQGLSYQEIAAALAVKSNYVGSLIARGRKEFIRLYGKTGGRA